MKTLSAKAKISGFTLIELLVIVFVLVILAALLLPALAPVKSHRPIQCMSNQKQIVISLLMFKGDNSGKFPWQLSETNSGSMERNFDGHPSSQFRQLLPYNQNFSTYVCPSDTNQIIATNNADFSDQNVSYFVNVDATANSADIVTGDRHLEIKGKPIKSGLFIYSTGVDMNWSRGFHHDARNKPLGGISFADGHVQFVDSDNLNLFLQNQSSATNNLAVP